MRVGDRVSTPQGDGVIDYVRSDETVVGVKLDSAKHQAKVFLVELVAEKILDTEVR